MVSTSIHHIRHATFILKLASKRLLVDPMLAPKETYPAIPFTGNKRRNPLCDLPTPLPKLDELDAVLLTHLHQDHFDQKARDWIRKETPIFCQPTDEAALEKMGFKDVRPIEKETSWEGFAIRRRSAKHGKGFLSWAMGKTSSYVIEAAQSGSIYIAGDAIYEKDFEAHLQQVSPKTVVLNAGAAGFLVGAPITQTETDILNIADLLPDAKIIVLHMDAMNHCRLDRKKLIESLRRIGNDHRVVVPENGEVVRIQPWNIATK